MHDYWAILFPAGVLVGYLLRVFDHYMSEL